MKKLLLIGLMAIASSLYAPFIKIRSSVLTGRPVFTASFIFVIFELTLRELKRFFDDQSFNLLFTIIHVDMNNVKIFMARDYSYLEEWQFKKKSGRDEPCTEKLTVRITPSAMDYLNGFGRKKADKVREAIDLLIAKEELERESSQEKEYKYPKSDPRGLRVAETENNYEI